MENLLIEVKNLEKTYLDGETQTRALSGVSFNIKEGEFVAVMGPSGSGKSTLLHILGFLDDYTKGTYYFDGKDASKYSQQEIARVRNKKMGFIFQAFNLLPRTTVLENVKLPLLYSGTKEFLWNKTAEEAIGQVGLSHRINHETSQLSGGEKQRVAIARALVNEPPVIFADEPTGNLDSKSGSQVMEIIEKLNNEGHTIILITHETYTAEYAQRIIKLKDGLIESDDQVTQRRRNALNSFNK
ncbi:MAG: ABC transporter ATP-binding protein [Candidatus Pacebacteria bacterium]|nr:ABC transporter ATP-binding protein [Candidatus Paceibacterota bacterium]